VSGRYGLLRGPGTLPTPYRWASIRAILDSPTVAKRVVLTAHEPEVTPRALLLSGDLRYTLKSGAPEIERQRDVKDARQSRIEPHRKLSASNVSALHQRPGRREGLRLSRLGYSTYARRSGQNARWTAGLSPNNDRNTTPL
jgi:hypothetical protein